MQIDILTLFPEIFEPFLSSSIIKKARDKGLVNINLINFRDYSPLKNKQVDDTPYGGGAGMVLRCEPIFECLEAINYQDAHVILLSPEGTTYKQSSALHLTSKYQRIILICGHYEGFDERIKTLVDEVISIGDFILTGGEIPAMAITDSIVRLIPGVISDDSLNEESFNNNLLDYPTYTKPRVYRNIPVPDVLLSGDHKKIEEYRKQLQIEKTKELRPDLIGDKND